MSTFTPNVPVSGQSLGSSRPVINSNFMAIQSTFDENHVDFNLANAGAHTHADLLAQSSDPNPATGLVSHYSKAVSGVTEWFFQRENTGAVIQMSKGTPVVNSTGRTFLPGGLIMLWGTCSISTTGTTTNNFQGGGFPTACLTIQITYSILPVGAVICSSAVPISLTQFVVTTNITSSSFSATPGGYYLAIGY